MIVKYLRFAIISLIFVPLISLHAQAEIPHMQQVAAAEKYLNKITTLIANFIQVSENGKISHGKLWISKPGQLRMDYIKPSEISIVLNDKKVTYFDKELDEISRSSFESVILSFLTKSDVSLLDNVTIMDVKKNNNEVKIFLTDPSNKEDKTLVLIFDELVSVLKAVDIIDIEGREIKIHLKNLQLNQEIDKSMFRIARDLISGTINEK